MDVGKCESLWYFMRRSCKEGREKREKRFPFKKEKPQSICWADLMCIRRMPNLVGLWAYHVHRQKPNLVERASLYDMCVVGYVYRGLAVGKFF